MPDSDHADPTFRHYFVDEAGDSSLFNKHGTTPNGNRSLLNHAHKKSQRI